MKVRLSGTLVRFADFQSEIEIKPAETVRTALEALSSEYPALKAILFTADGTSLRPVHQVFVSGKMVLPKEIDQSLNTNDEIEILTAIAGG